MQNILRNNWPSLLLVVGLIGFGFYLSPQLPDTLPTHWNFAGEADQFSSKTLAIWFLPLMTLGLIFFVSSLTKISPQKFSMPNSQDIVGRINFAVALLLAVIQCGILITPLKISFLSFDWFIGLGLGLFLVVCGNFMSKVERNFFIGIRVPWTLASEKNWRATHRFAARSMVIAGVLLLASLFFIQSALISIGLLLLSCLLPIFFSYRFFTKFERNSLNSKSQEI